MKKKLYLVVIICLLLICSACSNKKGAYTYTGEKEVNVDGKTFKLEDIPESAAEESLAQYYLYTITGAFDKKKEILADIEPHNISTNNEKIAFDEGKYVETYIIHEMHSLTKEEYSQQQTASEEYNELYYYEWQNIVDTYSLEDFEIIRVNFTITRSKAALEEGPQWDDGTHSRSYIVGKASKDKRFKIYDFGFM